MTDPEVDPRGDITRLLDSWRTGDQDAFEHLFAVIHETLRGLAQDEVSRADTPALNTTALIHQAYLSLVDQTHAGVRDRHHFFALAAKAMRHILVDEARRRSAVARGGTKKDTHADDAGEPVLAQAPRIVAIDRALGRLEEVDPGLGRIVEMRFFGGLSIEETAEALELAPDAVARDWEKARAYLRDALTGG